MKLNYFTYCFEKIEDKSQFRMDINDFIKSSTSNEALPFAKQNRYSGENLYLLPVIENFYLFVQTKDREIIKKIEKSDDEIKAHEIQSLLNKDESLGFASYVYFHPNLKVFGFASRVLSPKFTAFQTYINNLLVMLRIIDINFIVHPLKTEITKAQAMKLPFIGTTRFLIRKDSSLGESLKEFLLGSTNPNDLEIIESFEIIVKPSPRKSLTDTIKKTLNSMEDDGVKSIILRGKQNIEDNVKDFYIHSTGALYDEIKSTDENKIFNEIKEKIQNNTELKEKVEEYEHEIKEKMDDRISYLYSPANWASDRVCLFPLSQ